MKLKILGYETKKVLDPVLGERCGRVPPSDHKEEIDNPEKHDDLMYPGQVDFFTRRPHIILVVTIATFQPGKSNKFST